MTQMIRKQIYIAERQQLTLKRAAKARGVSEAELIRRAIDDHLGSASRQIHPGPAAWERERAFMWALHEQGPLPDRPRSWTRNELYDSRSKCGSEESTEESNRRER